jgi:hypothetical protein
MRHRRGAALTELAASRRLAEGLGMRLEVMAARRAEEFWRAT